MGLSFFHLVVVLVVVLILFGAGRLPHVMGDFGKGIRAFKEGLRGEEQDPKSHVTSVADDSAASEPPKLTDDKTKPSEHHDSEA